MLLLIRCVVWGIDAVSARAYPPALVTALAVLVVNVLLSRNRVAG